MWKAHIRMFGGSIIRMFWWLHFRMFGGFFLSIGCYCGAGVSGLIGCISLSPSLALLTFLNNNNICPKTPAPQYQPIDIKKRKGKRVKDYSRDRAAWAIKEALALLLKSASPTPSKTKLSRSFQRDTEKEIKVLLYCKVLQRGCA